MKLRLGRFDVMLIPAIIAYVGVFITGILNLNSPDTKGWVIGLMVAFGIVFFIPDFKGAERWLFHLQLAVLTGLTAGLLLIQPSWSVFPILFFLLSPSALIWFPNRAGVIWVSVFTLVTAVIFIASQGINGLIQLLPYSAGYLFFGIFGWTSFKAIHAQKRSEQLLSELQQAHTQLLEYANRLEELTITQERNRIAREMHDALGHRLTVSAVQLEGAQRLIRTDPERANQIVGTVREQIREGLGELRRTVAMLRAAVEEDLPIQQALSKLVDQTREATGLRINLSLEGCPELLPAPYRQALYRAAQEGLTNIQRHAQANEVWLRLSQRDDSITLLVGDNGIGISNPQDQSGFGLTGLKERAALLGGDFYVDPRPGGGSQLIFRLPVPKETQHDEPPCA